MMEVVEAQQHRKLSCFLVLSFFCVPPSWCPQTILYHKFSHLSRYIPSLEREEERETSAMGSVDFQNRDTQYRFLLPCMELEFSSKSYYTCVCIFRTHITHIG